MKVLIICVILLAAHAGANENEEKGKDAKEKEERGKFCYTQWFDRDNPSKKGDYETLTDLRKQYPGKICDKPLIIQATTLSGVPAQSTGQVFQKNDVVSGFICVNSQQSNGQLCLDYKVRFGCKCPWP